MDVRGSSQSLAKVDAEALAVPVFKGEQADNDFLKELDKAVGGVISAVISAEEFAAKEGETAYFPVPGRGLKAQRLLLIGCGDRVDYKARQVSQMAGTAARFLRSKNARTIAIVPRASEDTERAAQ
jgi:leucyl aminopeptidase